MPHASWRGRVRRPGRGAAQGASPQTRPRPRPRPSLVSSRRRSRHVTREECACGRSSAAATPCPRPLSARRLPSPRRPARPRRLSAARDAPPGPRAGPTQPGPRARRACEPHARGPGRARRGAPARSHRAGRELGARRRCACPARGRPVSLQELGRPLWPPGCPVTGAAGGAGRKAPPGVPRQAGFIRSRL